MVRYDGGRGHIWTCPVPTCMWEEHRAALTASGFLQEKVQMPFLCVIFFFYQFEWKFDIRSCEKKIEGCKVMF